MCPRSHGHIGGQARTLPEVAGSQEGPLPPAVKANAALAENTTSVGAFMQGFSQVLPNNAPSSPPTIGRGVQSSPPKAQEEAKLNFKFPASSEALSSASSVCCESCFPLTCPGARIRGAERKAFPLTVTEREPSGPGFPHPGFDDTLFLSTWRRRVWCLRGAVMSLQEVTEEGVNVGAGQLWHT